MPAKKDKESDAKNHEKDSYRNLVRVNYALGTFGILLLTAIFILYIRADYDKAKSSEYERLRLLATTSATRFESLVDTLLVTIRILDQWIQDNPERDPRTDGDFNRLVSVFRKTTGGKIDLRMVDERGTLNYLPSVPSIANIDVSDREYFIESRKIRPDTLYFAKPVLSRVTGLWGIPITYRLRSNSNGLFLLFGAIEFPVLDSLFPVRSDLSGHSIGLLRSDRTLLYRNPYDEYLVGEAYDKPIVSGGVSVVEIYNPNRSSRLISFQNLEQFALAIVVGVDYQTIRGKWIRSLVVKAILALAILGIYTYLTIRSIEAVKKNNEIQRMLQNAARYDSLTGLKNRGYFFERLSDELERASRYNLQFVFMILDIDHFKVLNDTYGHPEGDVVLKRITSIIDAGIRNSDISGRVGGEEFAVILTDVDLAHALPVAERIRERVTSIVVETWKASVSIGAVAWSGPEESLTDLYKRADDALYRAKNEGRNRVVAEGAS